jgi:hypothetical protein
MDMDDANWACRRIPKSGSFSAEITASNLRIAKIVGAFIPSHQFFSATIFFVFNTHCSSSMEKWVSGLSTWVKSVIAILAGNFITGLTNIEIGRAAQKKFVQHRFL